MVIRSLIVFLSLFFISFGLPLNAETISYPISTVPAPNWNIDFTWGGSNIKEGGLYRFIQNKTKESIFSWTSGTTGQVYGEIYKGELNNAVLVATHLLNSSGIATSTDKWLSSGKYFVVIYNANFICSVGDICFGPSINDIQRWFEQGFSSVNFFNSSPSNWGIINFTIAPKVTNTPPLLTYVQENGYKQDAQSSGVEPNKGTANKTTMIFKVVYTDLNNNAPSKINTIISNGISTTTLPMFLDTNATSTLRDNNFINSEQYIATSTFPKAKYKYYFEASGGIDLVKFPVDRKLPFETGYSNVAFLPGLEASRLYQKTASFENQIWEPSTDSDVQKLLLDSNGNSINNNIYTRDIIDQANIIPGYIFSLIRPNYYISFIEEMNSLQSSGMINEWEALPYDWRLNYDDILKSGKVVGSNGNKKDISYLSATSSPYIVQEIERLAKSSANGKVTIIAHSNGGLLAKKLIDKLNTKKEANLIENLILVATPQLGTPKAIASLLHGYEEGIPKNFNFFASRKVARKLGRNMIPGYDLLPSSVYMNRVKDTNKNGITQNSTTVIEFDPSLDRLASTIAFRKFWGTSVTTLDSVYNYRDYYGDKITTKKKLDKFLRGVEGRAEPLSGNLEYPIKLSKALLYSADSLHKTLDTWQPPKNSNIKVIQIAGWGLDTLRGIKYVAKDKQVCTDNLSVCETLPVLDMEPLFTSDGDRIVVSPSATAMSTSTYPTFYVNISDYNKELGGLRKNREHSDILEIKPLRDFIKNIIIGGQYKLLNHITSIKPIDKKTKLRLSIHSPVSINIYDSLGNHTGLIINKTSGIKYTQEQIPNSYYMQFGEGKYLGLDTNDKYTVKLKGKKLGTFTFDIQKVIGDKILNSVEYKNIPVSASTTAKLTIQNLNTKPKLYLDFNGDGVVDAVFDSNKNNDTLASIKILKSVISSIKMKKEFKRHVLRDFKRVEKDFKHGRVKKTKRDLDKIIRKFKKQIKENLEDRKDGVNFEKEKYNYEKSHYKHKDDRKKKDEIVDREKNKENEQNISTKDAWDIVGIIEKVEVLLL